MQQGLARLRNHLAKLTALPDAEWAVFVPSIAHRHYRKGESFVRQGEPCPEIGFVLNGVFRYVYLSAAGEEVIKSFAHEDMLISPYSAQLQDLPANLSIEAMSEAEILTVPYATQVALYPRHACWQEIGRKNAEQLYIAKERRERQLLLLDAEERLAAFHAEYPGLAARIPQYQIARYLGVNAETLSRIISRQQRATAKPADEI